MGDLVARTLNITRDRLQRNLDIARAEEAELVDRLDVIREGIKAVQADLDEINGFIATTAGARVR